jgi:hypothetical protein
MNSDTAINTLSTYISNIVQCGIVYVLGEKKSLQPRRSIESINSCAQFSFHQYH